MEKVSIEVAQEEINSWLDAKQVSEKKRETHKDAIENLVDAMVQGYLTLNSDTKEFTQVLKFPIEGEKPLTALKFKPRIKVEAVQMHLQGVKPTDNYGLISAYIAALTVQPKTLLKTLDTEDYSIAYGIAIFFM